MKKLFLSLCLFFSACAAPQPQVTVTSEVTVTSTPSPAPSPQATETKEATATATATPTPEPTPTFEPMELSKEPSANVQCTMDDIQSGRYAAAEAALGITFPETVKNNGWERNEIIGKTISVNLRGGATEETRPEKLASICYVDGEFLGSPGKKLAVIGIAVSNPDGSVRLLHFVIPPFKVAEILTKFPKKAAGIVGWQSETYKKEAVNSDPSELWYYDKLYPFQGEEKIYDLAKELNRTGIVTPDMEKVIWFFSLQPW